MTARTGLEMIAAARRRQAHTERATPYRDRRYTLGQLAAAARCYLEAADAVRSTLAWANDGGPRLADTYQGGAHRAEILEDVARAKADPLGYHYGRDTDGNVKLPSEWTLAPELWAPDNDPLVNLARAGALAAREIDRQRAELGPNSGHEAPAGGGHRWATDENGDPYWATEGGDPLATVEVYPATVLGRDPLGEVVRAEAEAALRHAVDLAMGEGQPATCESCPAAFEVMLPDGSRWCRRCDDAAVRLGYDRDPEDGEDDGDE